MDLNMTDVLVALIGAVGVIGAAWIALQKKNVKSSHESNKESPTFHVSAGNDAFVAGRDNVIHQNKDPVSDFFSAKAIAAISRAADDVIQQKSARLNWESFDSKLMSEAIVATPRGPGFSNAAAVPYHSPHYLDQWVNGGLVYVKALEYLENEGNGQTEDLKRLRAVITLYGINAKLAEEGAHTAQKLSEGVYLEMDDDKAIAKAKELKCFRALDVGAAKGGVAVVAKEQANSNGDIDLHVFINFTDQIADDNGFVHLVAHDASSHPDRKNKIWSALKEGYGIDPNEAIPIEH